MEFTPIVYVSPWVHKTNPGKAVSPYDPEASVTHMCFIRGCTYMHARIPCRQFSCFERHVSIKLIALLYPLEELAEVSHSLWHTDV